MGCAGWAIVWLSVCRMLVRVGRVVDSAGSWSSAWVRYLDLGVVSLMLMLICSLRVMLVMLSRVHCWLMMIWEKQRWICNSNVKVVVDQKCTVLQFHHLMMGYHKVNHHINVSLMMTLMLLYNP